MTEIVRIGHSGHFSWEQVLTLLILEDHFVTYNTPNRPETGLKCCLPGCGFNNKKQKNLFAPLNENNTRWRHQYPQCLSSQPGLELHQMISPSLSSTCQQCWTAPFWWKSSPSISSAAHKHTAGGTAAIPFLKRINITQKQPSATAFCLTYRGIILLDTRRWGERGETASLCAWLWFQAGNVFPLHFLALCVSLKQQIQTHTGKKHAHLLSLSLSWQQTQTHIVRLSPSITHSLQHLIQWVSVGPWDCYCSLSLPSSPTSTTSSLSSSSPLLVSFLLSCSDSLSAGDNQRHDWSEAEVVDATSCHGGLWWCRNQRSARSIGSFQQHVEYHVRSLQNRGGSQDTRDEKESFNYHLFASHVASNLLERITCTDLSRQQMCICGNCQVMFPTTAAAINLKPENSKYVTMEMDKIER